MRTILVVNSKGGCGKTTLSTNLASYYAAAKLKVAIRDYDPQGSSLQWLASRPSELPRIYGANAAPEKRHSLRSMHSWVPSDTQVLIIDPPGGVSGLLLQDILLSVDSLLIPVAPSSIDIHASAAFIRTLLLKGRIRSRGIRLGVVAYRVRNSMPVYEPLERFLRSLNLPLLTRIPDSDNMIRAAEKGVGIFEMDYWETANEREQFSPILKWLDVPGASVAEKPRPRLVSA